MRRISFRRASHWRRVVTRVPSFITMTSGMAVRAGSSVTPGIVPSDVAMRGTGISRGSGPLGGAAFLRLGLREADAPASPKHAIAAM